MTGRAVAPLLAAIVALVACTHPSIETIADRTTQAIFENDAGRARSAFVPNIRPSMSDASIAQISTMMHRYGNYRFVRKVSAGPEPNRYDFEAQFDTGSMLLQLKMDASGAIAAYRLIPNELPRRPTR